MAYWTEYEYLVVLGAFLAFFMAYGIGANDVANAFATSVGSRTLTLTWAVILAGIFEFGGAVLLGRGVTSTIKNGIADIDEFEDIPAVFAFGMLCALAAAGTWLLVATYLEMPVSTTHSIIGGIMGFALVAKGKDSIVWYEYDDEEIFPIQGVTAVVLSWIISPVCSGIVSAAFYVIARFTILRSANSYARAFWAIPVLILLCVFINLFYVLDKGISKQAPYFEDHVDRSAWVAAVVAVGCSILAGGAAFLLKARLDKAFSRETELANDPEAQKAADAEKAAAADKPKTSSFFTKISDMINSNDPHKELDTNEGAREMHDHAELFELRTENVFRYLQVITACADSFAHGANDVANAIGPFAAIWQVYRYTELTSSSEIPIWILVIGGVGIVIGLATFGYRIIKAIGVKLAKITPSRGFCIEMGSALVVVTGSYLELPLSTTHCQVGATVAVGLCEGTKGVGWVVVGKSIIGWIFTLILVGSLSALLMALGIFSPNLRASEAMNATRSAISEIGNAQITQLREAPGCAGNQLYLDNLLRAEFILTNTTQGVAAARYPYRSIDAVEYTSALYEAGTVLRPAAELCPAGSAVPAGGEVEAVPAALPVLDVEYPNVPYEYEEE